MDSDLRVGAELKALSGLLYKSLLAKMSETCLDEASVMNGYILRYLYINRERPIYQKDLESAFCINRSSVTSILKLMEKKGYIKRSSVENDARLKKLELTETGVIIQKEQEKILKEHNAFICSVIGDDRIDDFLSVVEDLKSALTKELAANKSKEMMNRD